MCYFIPGVTMKNEKLNLRLSADLRKKLFDDAKKNGFSSANAYMNSLIENGPARPDTQDVKLQDLEQKIDALVTQQEKPPFPLEQIDFMASSLSSQEKKFTGELDKIFRFSYVNYRLIIHILARLFYIKPGNISPADKASADAYINQQVKLMEERFGPTP